MKSCIPIVAVGLLFTACSKDKPPASATTTMYSSPQTTWSTGVDVGGIRDALIREHPDHADQIRALAIFESDGVVTLSGKVEDAELEREILARVRKMNGVRDVRDSLQVAERTDRQMEPPRQMSQETSARDGERSTDALRALMLRERPNESDVIRGLTITEDGDVIILSGRIYDEKTRKPIVDSAKKAAGGKTVRDEMEVMSKAK